MPDQLPKRIILGPDTMIPVEQRTLLGKLGCLDTRVGRIEIERSQPKAGKHLILLHELIHLVAEQLKEQGVVKRQPDEKFVTHLAGALFPMLALSGLWKGVTRREVEEFLAMQDYRPLAPGTLRSPGNSIRVPARAGSRPNASCA